MSDLLDDDKRGHEERGQPETDDEPRNDEEGITVDVVETGTAADDTSNKHGVAVDLKPGTARGRRTG